MLKVWVLAFTMISLVSAQSVIDRLNKPVNHPIVVASDKIFLAYVPCGVANITNKIPLNDGFTLKYLLYNVYYPTSACDLQPKDESLNDCDFDASKGTVVLIHGLEDKLEKGSLMRLLKDIILEYGGNYNVFLVDWTSYTTQMNLENVDYDVAAVNTFLVANKLASWIHFLKVKANADLESFHIIAHGLGTQIASTTGKLTCALGKITYLDPSTEIFKYVPFTLRLYQHDARFVVSISTSAWFSILNDKDFAHPIAHHEIFMNGGKRQPKCTRGKNFYDVNGNEDKVTSLAKRKSCKQTAVFEYYFQSFEKNCRFVGKRCKDYKEYTNDKCSNEECTFNLQDELDIPTDDHYKCFIDTSADPPYCLN